MAIGERDACSAQQAPEVRSRFAATAVVLLTVAAPLAWSVSAAEPPVVSGAVLTGDQSTFDGGAGTWAPMAPTTTLVWTGTGTHQGPGALALVNVNVAKTKLTALSGSSPDTWAPALPGNRYTVRLWARATGSGRKVQAFTIYFDSAGQKLVAVNGQVGRDAPGMWTAFAANSVAPPTAAYVAAGFFVAETVAGEAHFIDDVTLTTVPGGSDAVVGPVTTLGNRIVDGNGAPLRLRGFTRGGLEGIAAAPPDEWEISQAKLWGANFMRLALGAQFWLDNSCRYDASYATRVDDVVGWLTSRGMVALLDMHTNTVEPCGAAGQQPMADYPNAIAYWQQVAARYKDNPLVAFDLYNEPHHISDAVWRDGGTVTFKGKTFQAAGMQQMYDAVRSTGATNLIVASGNNWANTVPKGYLLTGTNIAYGVHVYTCPTVAPPACTNPAPYDPQQILGAWVNLSRSVPVLVTEFGWPDPQGWQYNAKVIGFAEQKGWGWAAYTWGNAAWGPFSMLLIAGDGVTYQPSPGGMPALAAFPGPRQL